MSEIKEANNSKKPEANNKVFDKNSNKSQVKPAQSNKTEDKSNVPSGATKSSRKPAEYTAPKPVPAGKKVELKLFTVTNNTDHQIIINSDDTKNPQTDFILGPKARVKLKLTQTQADILSEKNVGLLSFQTI